jgi:hypothetical protein
MGAFGLVWYVYRVCWKDARLISRQLGKGPAHQPGRGHQEDYEAIQHPGLVEAHIPRVEASEAFEARECVYCNDSVRRALTATGHQPKRHLHFPARGHVGTSQSPRNLKLTPLATSSPSSSALISTVCLPRDRSRSSLSNTSFTRFWLVPTYTRRGFR